MRSASTKWVLAGLMLTGSTLSAAVLGAAFTATTASDDFCNPGPRSSSFLTTDDRVWLYVSMLSGATGDKLTVNWIRPGGSVYYITEFTPLSGPGDWCFDAAIHIAGYDAEQYTGTWTVEGYYNGARIFSTQFTLSETGGGGGPTGSNLIVNPGAEAGPGSIDPQPAITVPGWTVNGNVAIVQYGGNEIPANSPGPVDRGINHFSGGPDNATSSLTQRISVAASASLIDAGNYPFTLSGWLGGWDGQDDNVQLWATFRSPANADLGTVIIGPVYSAERGGITGLVQKTQTGTVPVNTRSVDIQLLFNRVEGSYNDGIADNLSLVLGTGGGGGGGTCNYLVSPLTSSIGAGGGTGLVLITTATSCTWTASSNVSWITITAGTAGTGSGAVSYTVAANPTTAVRTGTVTIAGQTHTVTQAAGSAACSYSLNKYSVEFTPAASSGGILLTVNGSGCSWTAVSNAAWIAITSASSGTTNATINYSVAANGSASARTGTLTIAGLTFTITQAGASPNAPEISEGGVLNAASYTPATLDSGAIARGSFFSIFGANLGPAQYQSQMQYPLPTNLAEVTVTIRKGSTAVQAYMVFVSATQINAIMPSNAPTGDVEVIVTYRGAASPPVSAKVVDSNFGVFSTAGGRGPGIIQNYVSPTELPLNSRHASADLGQVEVLLGTGLGPISAPDNQTPPVGDLPVSVQVLVGGKEAQILYKGRMPGVAGVDQVNFMVPMDAPLGCYVPVQIKVGGNFSNTVTMAIHPSGGTCEDATNPVSALAADGGKAGEILLIRAKVKAELQAGDPPLDLLLDLGVAQFQEFAPGGDLGFNPLLSFPPVGSCIAYSGALDLGGLIGGDTSSAAGDAALLGRPLDAGPEVTVTGPVGTIPLPKSDTEGASGVYAGMLGGAIPIEGAESLPPFLDGGTYRISGTGGADVGPFTASITLGSPVIWTNQASTTELNRNAPLTVTWSGGDATKEVIVAAAGVDQNSNAAAGFYCFVKSEPGSFTVPAAMLSNLPAGAETAAAVIVGDVQVGNIVTFAASGVDKGIVVNGTLNVQTVPVR